MTPFGVTSVSLLCFPHRFEIALHPVDAGEKVEDLLKRPNLTQVPIPWGNGSSLIQ